MATFEKFEDLEVWKLSMNLCIKIYSVTDEGKIKNDFSLKEQIRKSAISIPSNIAEGFERDSINQFIYFLNISKGSCGELRTQIRIANSIGYISETTLNELNDDCLNISKQLKGFINYLTQKKQNNINKK